MLQTEQMPEFVGDHGRRQPNEVRARRGRLAAPAEKLVDVDCCQRTRIIVAPIQFAGNAPHQWLVVLATSGVDYDCGKATDRGPSLSERDTKWRRVDLFES